MQPISIAIFSACSFGIHGEMPKIFYYLFGLANEVLYIEKKS